jgi:hypothetical protein
MLGDVRSRVGSSREPRGRLKAFNLVADEPDCLAEVVGLELRNVVVKYPFERSHRFPGIQPNSGGRDYSRLSCDVGNTQLRPRTLGEVGRNCRLRFRDDPAPAN